MKLGALREHLRKSPPPEPGPVVPNLGSDQFKEFILTASYRESLTVPEFRDKILEFAARVEWPKGVQLEYGPNGHGLYLHYNDVEKPINVSVDKFAYHYEMPFYWRRLPTPKKYKVMERDSRDVPADLRQMERKLLAWAWQLGWPKETEIAYRDANEPILVHRDVRMLVRVLVFASSAKFEIPWYNQ